MPSAAGGSLMPRMPACRFGPYFVEPIVAGLNSDKKPFISAFDLIGAPVITDDFVVGGTCTNNLYGMCESLYRPDMVRAVVGGLGSATVIMRAGSPSE